ncbi:unnamed protein product, partial [Dovyalis caffra]
TTDLPSNSFLPFFWNKPLDRESPGLASSSGLASYQYSLCALSPYPQVKRCEKWDGCWRWKGDQVYKQLRPICREHYIRTEISRRQFLIEFVSEGMLPIGPQFQVDHVPNE